MGLNKITAKKSMSDLSSAHMQAGTVLRQLTIYLSGLGMNNQTGIFLPAPVTFSGQESIEEKDNVLLISRIQMVYRKAVIRMRYYPEIWFMAYSWTTSVGRKDEGLAILKAGLDANPARHVFHLSWISDPSDAPFIHSFALTYAYAELLEKSQLTKDHRDFTEIHSVYERFFGKRPTATPQTPRPPLLIRGRPCRSADPPTKEELAERKKNQEELPELKKQYSNTWINYMRLARRAQGHKTCRDVFGKARKDEYIGWEVYEAGAMTEYRCNLEDRRLVAARIFETGMKKYSSHSTYVLSHLGFLLTVNDENSIYPHTYHSIGAIANHDLGFAKTRKLATISNVNTSYPPMTNHGSSSGNGISTNGNGPTAAVQSFAQTPTSVRCRRWIKNMKRTTPSDHDQTTGTAIACGVIRRRLQPSATPQQLPPILFHFVSQLPPRETFHGPIFNIDNLMDKLCTAVSLSCRASSGVDSAHGNVVSH
ncbi:hypothetical protein B0H16DRAFT_1756546 [Mycena metata]|uniref:mRNA 3'-end-processing protein RNA14 n=1 Tax=Mycena metata TaxID=1033252 RepID=A0AAD7NU95_9AGAR|nr:hypothetical protein B0H16DRAFT_1756546 [Mycena metata]